METNSSLPLDINEITILLPNGEAMPLEEYSPIIKGLIQTSIKKAQEFFIMRINNEKYRKYTKY